MPLSQPHYLLSHPLICLLAAFPSPAFTCGGTRWQSVLTPPQTSGHPRVDQRRRLGARRRRGVRDTERRRDPLRLDVAWRLESVSGRPPSRYIRSRRAITGGLKYGLWRLQRPLRACTCSLMSPDRTMATASSTTWNHLDEAHASRTTCFPALPLACKLAASPSPFSTLPGTKVASRWTLSGRGLACTTTLRCEPGSPRTSARTVWHWRSAE